MAKTLEFSDTSAQTVKIGDTTTSFTMVLGEDNNPVDLTNVTGIIAKLGNSTGYLKSQTITADNIPDPLSGKVIIKFDSDFMNGLPAGYYLLEVWVTYDSGTAIYPSGDLTGFTINNNIESQSGSVINTITYDDFVKAMNEAASTIAKGDKGDKGDTGTVDNAGLISAPAFQSLQTQVNNSAVGTNLATGTSSDWQKASFSGNWGVAYLCDPMYEIVNGETYTLQVEVRNITSPIALDSFSYTAAGTRSTSLAPSTSTQNDTKMIVTFTANLPANYAYFRPDLAFTSYLAGTGSYEFRRFKIERGNKATDWYPNPSEVLTQANYAKIKAAIVALGGSLS